MKDNEINRLTGTVEEEEEVTNMLIKLGVPTNLVGYKYLKEAIIIWRHNPGKYSKTEVYTIIANRYGKNPNSVNTAMQHAVEYSWDEIDDFKFELFRNCLSLSTGCPYVSGFITAIVEFLNQHNLESISEEEKKVADMLLKMGMPTKLKGYEYFKEAIIIYTNKPAQSLGTVYFMVAEKFGTTCCGVEHALHYVLARTMENGKEELNKYLNSGYIYPGELIKKLAKELRCL